ncbi:hypothetical protein BDZ94DRAFT_527900 [Collybia nuda]|uniref:NOT2/NOT3/NOT5 C-terminal domain-containing protein n=1 Tax=Collybia nuda TaxID=64659 RepID=A0A9P5Y8H2_9AGAR|nr:hypothetical protein BDZ94DRAFT_527900 [Collybia nuda]
MNRPGQPQQRPPSLVQNPGLASQFRPPYPAYGMPPRNVNSLQGGGYVPGLQPSNHRTPSQQSQVQTMVSQSTPSFIQQRGQSSFAFGGSLLQHQSTTLQQQQQSSSHQHQQTNGTSTSLPPHLVQTPSLGTAPSVSSASDVGLDPNDFPALGSTPANNSSTSGNGGAPGGTVTSYASQAGTGVPLGGAGSASSGAGTIGGGVGGGINSTRDFTPDDFPALGGQSQAQGQNSQNQNPSQDNQSHPPGLNGFQHNDHAQQNRQNAIGALGGNVQPGTPGMLNLGQSRNVHPGFQQGQSEAEKQQQRNNYAIKLNQATHAAWNSPNANPGSQTQGPSSSVSLTLGSGAFSNPPPAPSTQTQQNGTHSIPTPSTTHLDAPPGVPPPSGLYTQQTHTTGVASAQTAYTSNGAPGDSHSTNNPPNNSNTHQISLQPSSISHSQQHPQTPAEQVLVSAADRWGLLGLLAMLKNAGTDLDQGLGGIGTDLGTMGLDMAFPGNLYSTFITPWADQSAARTVEPDFHLPTCYSSVQAPPPGPNKATAFSDETLFFMFYSSPRDALQEVAAQELWNRNWRYHKDLRLWITKESGTSPSQKVQGGEQGQYTFWDPENWVKERKEMIVLYVDLEEKNVPAFVQGPGLVLAQPTGQGQAAGQQPQAQVGIQGQPGQLPPTQRGSFQMGMAGL